jgi:hypothetical protein
VSERAKPRHGAVSRLRREARASLSSPSQEHSGARAALWVAVAAVHTRPLGASTAAPTLLGSARAGPGPQNDTLSPLPSLKGTPVAPILESSALHNVAQEHCTQRSPQTNGPV